MSEQVNHPSHYNQGKFEVIEIIEDQQPNFHLGNAIKYICRAGKKNPEKTNEDLQKAIWYINRYIEIQKPKDQVRRPNDMNEYAKNGYEEVIDSMKGEMKWMEEIINNGILSGRLSTQYKERLDMISEGLKYE